MQNEKAIMPEQSVLNNPSIIFKDGQCQLSMVTQAGTKIEHYISMEAVREAATKIPVDTGWLPPEVIRWGKGSKGEWCAAFIAPGRHRLELLTGTPGENEQVEYVTAPLPGMVMFGHGASYFVWAQKTDRYDPLQEVFRCPLPNVMQDASVCWGLVKPPIASPKTIMKAWNLFITSTFNNHAANAKSKIEKEDIRLL